MGHRNLAGDIGCGPGASSRRTRGTAEVNRKSQAAVEDSAHFVDSWWPQRSDAVASGFPRGINGLEASGGSGELLRDLAPLLARFVYGTGIRSPLS
jgi:hypothetical protein